MNLKGKKVLITGATGGIGNELVKKFSNLGASIIGTGTNQEKLDKLRKEYSNLKTKQFKLDTHDKIEEFVESCANDLGGLDILINNAGITRDNISLRLTFEDWKKVMDINLTSTFLMCKFAIKKC